MKFAEIMFSGALVASCFVSGSQSDDPRSAAKPQICAAEIALSGVYINARDPNGLVNTDGIRIEPMAAIVRALGKPAKVTVKNKCESDYLWIARGIRIEVYSGCIFQNASGKEVMRGHGAYGVEVWGRRSEGGLGITGSGLALGDKLDKVKKLYGTRCQCGRYISGTGTQNTHGLRYAYYAIYQWGSAAELSIDADANGRVVHIQLLGDIE